MFNLIAFAQRVFKTIFWIPLSVGNMKLESTNNAENSATASVLFACLFNIMAVVIGNYNYRHRVEFEVISNVLWQFIFTLIIIATIGILVLFCLLYKSWPQLCFRYQTETDSSSKLQLGFLWTFGLLLIVKNSLAISGKIECFMATPSVREIESTAYLFVKIVFLTVQMALISCTWNLRIKWPSWVMYIVGIVMLANVSIWYKQFLSLISETQPNNFRNSSETELSENISDSFRCYRQTKIYKFNSKWKCFLLQISLHFLLLTTKFIRRAWTSAPDPLQDNHSQSCDLKIPNFRKTKIAACVLGIVLNTPLLLVGLLLRFTILHRTLLQNTLNLMKVLQKGGLLLLIFVAFSSIDMNKKNQHVRHIDINDTLVLLCVVGKIVVHAMELFTTVYCFDNIVLCLKGLISLVFDFYHTMYILISRRLSKIALNQSSISVFVHVLMFIVNIIEWVMVTFILSLNGAYVVDEGQNCLFNDPLVWPIIQYIAIPFTLFYDFQSAMYFYSASI